MADGTPGESAAIPAVASIQSSALGAFGAGIVGPASPSSALHNATHALLRMTSAAEAIAIVNALVVQLGGRLVPGHSAPTDALLIDCSLGYGETRYPESDNPATLLMLRDLLPPFLEDVEVAIKRLPSSSASGLVDPLTSLLTPEAGARRLPRLVVGDVVVAMGLKGLADGNPIWGRGNGEGVIAEFAKVLHQEGRTDDAFVRCEGRGEFLALLREPGPHGAVCLLERVNRSWRPARPYPIDVAAAQVRVRTSGVAAAEAALVAMRDIVANRPSSVVDIQQPAIAVSGF